VTQPRGPSAAAGESDEPAQAGGAAADIASLPFDRALADLQGVVARLETGGLPLEESIALYERGVALHEHCARLLTDAELRVQRLVEGAGGGLRVMDFDPDEAESS
jgi:exodeoxyribonuclease VII small subunit